MDQIIKNEKAIIQHGKYNDRIYIMKIKEQGASDVLNTAEELLADHQYGKVFAKVSAADKEAFEKNGYIEEAMIPDFFGDNKDVLFMSKFVDPERSIDSNLTENEDVLNTTFNKTLSTAVKAPSDFEVTKASKADSEEIASLYRETFPSYPFPIYDPEYVSEMMQEDVDYYLIKKDGQLAAVSSAEKDPDTKTAEMTDFATKEEFQGNQLAAVLLSEMENRLKEENYRLAFTIARACSVPMNVTFARAGYAFSGKLVNNTNISDDIESMNIWYKKLK